MEEVIARLRAAIEEYGLSCEVTGRLKEPYSLYKKMQDQNLSLDEIYDMLEEMMREPDPPVRKRRRGGK